MAAPKIFPSVFLFFSATCLAQDMPLKSILEIKLMQTRVFERGQKEMVDGIKEYWTNRNGKCNDGYGTHVAYYQAANPQQIPFDSKSQNPYEAKFSYDALEGVMGKLVCTLPGYPEKNIGGFKWEYEITLPRIPYDGKPLPLSLVYSLHSVQAKKITVRARVYLDDGNKLSLDEEIYSIHFKRLSDALFLNSIELVPKEMH